MTPEVLTPDVLKSNTNIFKTSSNLKSRKFLLTLNEPERYNNLKEYLLNLSSFKYLISSKEKAPTTGHEHIHIFFYSTNPIKLNLKKTEGANIVICNGTPQQIKEYVIKDGEIIDELGTEPHQGKKNFNFNELLQMTTEDILNNDDLNLLQKRTTLNLKKEAHNKPLNKTNFIKNMNVYYIYTNKDYNNDKDKLYDKAFDIINDNEFDEIEFKDGFIIGYKLTSHYCIIPNFNDKIFDLNYFKKFIDKYRHNINIKGGEAKNNYDNIIFLSSQSPYNIYNLNIDDNIYDKLNIIRI